MTDAMREVIAAAEQWADYLDGNDQDEEAEAITVAIKTMRSETQTFVVLSLVNGEVRDLEVMDAAPTFELQHDQRAFVANMNGGDSVKFVPA